MSERVTFQLQNALGDTVVMSAAVRDLALQYPGKYQIGVWTHCQTVWTGNPYARKFDDPGRIIQVNYQEEMRKAHAGHKRHFLGCFYDIFSDELGISLEITKPKPDLYVSAHPVATVPGPYWVIAPGWKEDMPAKAWSLQYWQKLVLMLTSWGLKLVQVGAGSFVNPVLEGVHSLVGHTTDIPTLFSVVAKAEGVICGITSLMHIAAAFEKPCVVIAGGREGWWWEAYCNENPGFGAASGSVRVPHRYLHTIGQLSCCQTSGCGKQGLVEGRRHKLHEVCLNQTHHGAQSFSTCLARITPEIVRDNVLSYYVDGTLPPSNPQLKDLPMLPPVSENVQVLRSDGTTMRISVDSAPVPALPAASEDIVRPKPSANPVWSDPRVGGRVTVCILGYGDHFDVTRRCVDGVLRTTAKEQVEIRVGGNMLCRRMENYLELLALKDEVQHLNLSPLNRFKYPAMRDMFRRPPLTTEWLVWLDDDAEIVDPEWLDKMLECVLASNNPEVRWCGPLYTYKITERWKAWCEEADWYKTQRRPWPPEGRVVFCSGGLWLIHVPTLLAADIPDYRLGNNKGDVTIGLQMHQAGASAACFAPKKEHVKWSNHARRGVTTIHPAER